MLSLFNPYQNFRDLISMLRRHQDGNGLAYNFLCLVSENILSSHIPRLDNTVQVLSNDRILCALNNCSQATLNFFRLLAFGNDVEYCHKMFFLWTVNRY